MIKEKCGIFGVYGKGFEAARLTYFGLYALQHRGQESSGIVSSDGTKIYSHVGMGLVAHVYDEQILAKLKGYISIGQNRYATSGTSAPEHCQPVIVRTKNGKTVSLAHNGNLPTTHKLEEFLTSKNISIEGLNDSEMMTHAIAYYVSKGRSLPQAVKSAYPLFTGVFCLLIMTKDEIVAVRDRCGIRPFSIGKINGGFVFASETCALDIVGAKFLRSVKPGELISLKKGNLNSIQIEKGEQKLDVFEYVYFARPDSIILGQSVDLVRQRFGEQLAKEQKIQADVVIPVPDSATPAALGYARASGIPFYMGLIKNRYVHRTFITPEQHTRKKAVQLKLNPMQHIIKGKRVILVDDSIVRGTTMEAMVRLIREAGAREVHLLISCPPVRFPDFYGINTPHQSELIAAKKSIEEIRKEVNADTLQYLSYEGMIKATGLPEKNLCTSCFTGEYPIDIGEKKLEIRYNGKKRIAVFVSSVGTGSNLQAIIDGIKSGKIYSEIVAVVSNKEEGPANDRAKAAGLPLIVCKKKEDLLDQIKTFDLDYICLAGWNQVLSDKVVEAFENKIINLHPGAIPDGTNGPYKNPDGTLALWNRGMLVKIALYNVLDSRATYASSSIHFVTKTLDGGPVIARHFEKIKKTDTFDTLYERFRQKENELYASALQKLTNGHH